LEEAGEKDPGKQTSVRLFREPSTSLRSAVVPALEKPRVPSSPAPAPGRADLDRHWLGRAIELAEAGRGRVEPNPVVGAVVLDREGRKAGEGWHAAFGGPHAEVIALRAAGPRARGGTLYVSLEPCAHQGKTPPCTGAILEAGVARVVAALADPNPVAGGGAAILARAGIPTEVGVHPDEAALARRQNAPFVKLVTRGLPFVTLKWAMTLDGKIASVAGDSRFISGEAARRRVHEMRDLTCAVLAGIGTVLADDPWLTTRLDDRDGRTALRVVVDSSARLPLGSRLVSTAALGPVLVATTLAAPEERVAALRARGVLVEPFGPGPEVDLEALLRALARRPPRAVANLLVEGGGRVHAAFVEAGLADRVAVFVAPKLLGGAEAMTPVEGRGFARLAEALKVASLRATPVGEDWLLEGEIESASPGGEGGLCTTEVDSRR